MSVRLISALAATLVSLNAAQSARSDTAELKSFRPWDLAYILPLHASPQEIGDVLKISDLGYGTPEIRAMIDHISQKTVLPASAGLDSDKLSEFRNGTKILGGVLNDREGHNATNPPTAFRIEDEESSDTTACFNDPNSWHMVQLRIGPYKIQPSGSPAVFLAWAKGQGHPIDRIIQVRIAFRPYCKTKAGDLTPSPAAIHFAFELRPDDANLLRDPTYTAAVKNPKGVSSEVWGKSGAFMNASRSGNSGAAMSALHDHLTALNSPDYAAFRRYVLKALASLATARASMGPGPFQGIDQALDTLRADAAFSEKETLPSFAHPALRSGAATRGALLAAVNAFARKFATRGNVTAIAGFVTEAGGRSYFSNFGMQFPQTPPNSQSKADYDLIHPNSMDTTVAQLEGTFVHLYPGKTSNLYAQADAVGDSQEPGFAFRAIQASTPGALIDQVDLNSQFTLKNDGRGNQSIVFSPLFPDRGADLHMQIARLANPAQTLPSTTSCVNCHLLPRVGLTATDPTSVQILKRPGFLLLNEASLTARTEGELDHEFKKLNLEWLGSAHSDCADAGALRACLDQADATAQPATGCLDRLCSN